MDADQIERARSVRIEDVIATHGLRGLRGRVERVGACPVCGGTDRFSINVKKQVFNCRGCGAKGNSIALEMFLTGGSFNEAVQRLSGEPWRPSTTAAPTPAAAGAAAVPDPPKAAHGDDAADELKRSLGSAARYVSELKPLLGTPGAAYLEVARKINIAAIEDALARADAIGWHDAVYFNEPGHALHGQRLGCIVAVMSDPVTAKPTGAIGRTYIGPDGSKVAKSKTLGRPLGVVRLSGDEETFGGGDLFIAEGIETALSAMSVGMRPIWAAGCSGTVEKLPPLLGVDRLVVVADHDPGDAGEKAAREVVRRWRSVGRDARMFMHPRARADFNNCLKEAVNNG